LLSVIDVSRVDYVREIFYCVVVCNLVFFTCSLYFFVLYETVVHYKLLCMICQYYHCITTWRWHAVYCSVTWRAVKLICCRGFHDVLLLTVYDSWRHCLRAVAAARNSFRTKQKWWDHGSCWHSEKMRLLWTWVIDWPLCQLCRLLYRLKCIVNCRTNFLFCCS